MGWSTHVLAWTLAGNLNVILTCLVCATGAAEAIWLYRRYIDTNLGMAVAGASGILVSLLALSSVPKLVQTSILGACTGALATGALVLITGRVMLDLLADGGAIGSDLRVTHKTWVAALGLVLLTSVISRTIDWVVVGAVCSAANYLIQFAVTRRVPAWRISGASTVIPALVFASVATSGQVWAALLGPVSMLVWLAATKFRHSEDRLIGMYMLLTAPMFVAVAGAVIGMPALPSVFLMRSPI